MSEKLNKIHIIGPCALENQQQMEKVFELAQEIGVTYIRAQLFKPRTSPKSFQGIGKEGLSILDHIKAKAPNLKFVCEVCSLEQFEIIKNHASIIQIGARNMQNFELLKQLSQKAKKFDYILLKRGFANNLNEWIMAAQYLIQGGIEKDKILLCERGTRTISSPTGVHLDFLTALEAKKMGFKVIIDPSHGTKRADFVAPLAIGAMAMNFDGLMIETHPTPALSVSDKDQAIDLDECKALFNQLT